MRLGASVVLDYTCGMDALFKRLAAHGPFDIVFDSVHSIEAKDVKYDYRDRIHRTNLLKRQLNAPATSKSNYITIGGSFWDWTKAVLRRKYGINLFTSSHELHWVSFPNSWQVLGELAALYSSKAIKPVVSTLPAQRFRTAEPVREAFEAMHQRRAVGKLVLVLVHDDD